MDCSAGFVEGSHAGAAWSGWTSSRLSGESLTYYTGFKPPSPRATVGRLKNLPHASGKGVAGV